MNTSWSPYLIFSSLSDTPSGLVNAQNPTKFLLVIRFHNGNDEELVFLLPRLSSTKAANWPVP